MRPGEEHQRTVLGLGASAMRGVLGHNWMENLGSAYPCVHIENTGRDGDMAVSVDRRLDAVLEQHPRPWAAVLLAGTNDVLATHSLLWRCVEVHHNRLPPGTAPSLEFYITHMESILRKLARAAPECRVAVLSVPTLGEDLGSELNAKVRRYNAALQAAVARAAGFAHAPQFVDLHAAMERSVAESQRRRGGERTALHRRARRRWGEAMGFHPGVILVQALTARFMHAVLGWPWSRASRLFGLRLLTDHVHFNEIAGAMAARLVATQFLGPALS